MKFDKPNINLANWRFPCFLFALSVLLCSVLGYFNDIPERDVSGRYAPMATAFSEGDWDYAFHPRVPPLLPVGAGITVWLTGCSGFTAAKAVSILFFALSVFPLYGILRRTFDETTARWGCILLLLCSHLIRIAVSGLRDSAKGLAMLIAVYALICVWQQRKKISGYLWCAVGATMLSLTRGDCTLYALLFLCAVLFFDMYRKKPFFIPWRTGIAVMLYLLFLSPQLAYNYRTIGYPVPEVRYAVMLSKLEYRLNLNFYNHNAIVKLPGMLADLTAVPATGLQPTVKQNPVAIEGNHRMGDMSDESSSKTQNGHSAAEFIDGLFKGFYPYFFLLAVPVIVMRIYRREWKTEESILLAVLLGHAFLIVMQIIIFDKYLYISRRYLLPVAPIAFGWSAIGVLVLWGWMRSKMPLLNYRVAAPAVFAACAITLLADSAMPVIKVYTSRNQSTERQATLVMAEFIKKDFDNSGARINRELDCFSYRSNRRPLIISDLNVIGYCSGGQNIDREDADVKSGSINPDYIVESNVIGECETQYSGFNRIKKIQINKTEYVIWKAGSKSL